MTVLFGALALTLGTACGGGGGGGGSTPDPTPPSAPSLAVTVAGLPSGVDAAVVVTGPSGYTQSLTGTQTLTGLTAGTYTITASTVEDPSAGPLGLGLSPTTHLALHPWRPSQTVAVATGTASATVRYPDPVVTVQIPNLADPLTPVPMEFVLVPAGSFTMGSTDSLDSLWSLTAREPHLVTFTTAFYVAKTPCTQAQWKAVMGTDPEYFAGNPTHPVTGVSWNALRNAGTGFLAQLTDHSIRLPSEAEFEYFLRAGTTSAYFFGDSVGAGSATLAEYSWQPDGVATTQPVGGNKPNPWGLYDTIGHVWQWCEDDTHFITPPPDNNPAEADYTGAPVDGSAWVDASRPTSRIMRGGSFVDVNVITFRSALRGLDHVDYHGPIYTGFRLVMPVPPLP